MSYQPIEMVNVQSDTSDENSNTDENNTDYSLDLLIMETDTDNIQEKKKIKRSRQGPDRDSALSRSPINKKITKNYYRCRRIVLTYQFGVDLIVEIIIALLFMYFFFPSIIYIIN
jgi:hypothetical protein